MRRFWLFSLFAMLSISTVFAQEPPLIVRETIGRHEVVIRAPATYGDEFDAVQQAARAALPIFAPLWADASDFPILIDFVDARGDTGQSADTAFEDVELPATEGFPARATNACYVKVFLTSTPRTPESVHFDVAHELAHCFQRNRWLTITPDEAGVNQWYVEGSADWMATLVYPLSSTPLHHTFVSNGFVENLGKPLISDTLGYEDVYFWVQIAREKGTPATIALLRSLTADRAAQIGTVAAVLSDTAGFMFRFAAALSRGEVPDAPLTSTLYANHRIEVAATGTASISAHQLSVDFYSLAVTGIPDGKGVSITPARLSESNTRLALRNDTELSDGVALKVCDSPADILLYAGRGVDENPAVATVTLAVVDCIEETPTPVVLPDCLLGDWYYTVLPDMDNVNGPEMRVKSGYQRLTIYADGTAILHTRNWVLESEMQEGGESETTFIHGIFKITAYDESTGATEAEITSLNYGELIVRVHGGEVMRAGLADFGGEGLALPNTLLCYGNEENDLIRAVVSQGGIAAVFGLTR